MAMKRWVGAGLIIGLLALPGCGDQTRNAEDSAAVCGPDWYAFVESSVSTGDGRGHGPDPGSEEWRSTVEFRLGVRGLPEVPERMTEAWCRYVDAQLHAQ
jgi:hypothetical protein